MSKKILILNTNVSGMNNALFAELRKLGWELIIENIPNPKTIRWWALLKTFYPRLNVWKRRFDYHHNKLLKSPLAFKLRSAYCTRMVKKHKGKYDIILNISGMFTPSLGRCDKPSVVYSDYTMALALKYDPWSPYPKHVDKWLALEKDHYQHAVYVFTGSENTRQSVIHNYNISANDVIAIGYGTDFAHIPDRPKHYDGKTILFVGYDFERKGGPALLEAFKNVRREIPDARLIIVGPSKQHHKIVGEGIEFIGPLENREQLTTYYDRASIFVMPSVCEPYGFVFMEAMAHKLPCIGSRIDAIPEIIEQGKNGILVESGKPGQLANAIIELLKNKTSMKNMGAEAFQRNQKDFTWHKIGTKMDHFLVRCMKESK